MSRRSNQILAVVAITAMVSAGAIVLVGLRFIARQTFLDPVADATTDIGQYPALLAKWKPTGLVNHFPTVIPASAQLVRFSAFPGSGQGGSWIQLRLKLPPSEVVAIASIAKSLAGTTYLGGGDEFDHLNADRKHEWPTTSFHTGDNPASDRSFPKTYDLFVIKSVDRGMGSWDPYDGCGIGVSVSTNEVVYWASQ